MPEPEATQPLDLGSVFTDAPADLPANRPDAPPVDR